MHLFACIVGWLVIQDFENNVVWSSRWGILGLTVLVIHIAVRIFQWGWFRQAGILWSPQQLSLNRKPKEIPVILSTLGPNSPI